MRCGSLQAPVELEIREQSKTREEKRGTEGERTFLAVAAIGDHLWGNEKMSCQRNAGKITVPDDLRDVLLEFTISYLLEQPGDIIDYAVDFFTRLRDARRTQLIQTDGQTCSSTPDESVDEGESQESEMLLSFFFLSLSLSRAILSMMLIHS